jgi:hypothetical protein
MINTAKFSSRVAIILFTILSSTALGWSQEGHMVIGAIAYDELRANEPRLVEFVLDLVSQHPDRGPFEVAAGRATGEARGRLIFMEMARWPDDVRKGMYDHPTWHYSSRPLIDPRQPPPLNPRDTAAGSALEAFALNLSVAKDPRAPASDRAIALCWLFHLVGDIHQPLHAADEYSTIYPSGDRGGGLQYIIDPQSQQPMSLHWYWDQAVNRSSDAAASRAVELRARFPRTQFPELAEHAELTAQADAADDFKSWMAESYTLARSQAYRNDLSTNSDEKQAPALSAQYVANTSAVAERRLTLSSYRLVDVLRRLQ